MLDGGTKKCAIVNIHSCDYMLDTHIAIILAMCLTSRLEQTSSFAIASNEIGGGQRISLSKEQIDSTQSTEGGRESKKVKLNEYQE